MLMSVLGMGGFMAPQTTLAATQSVDSWIELSTGNPAPGCPMEVSVEVRSQGAPVTGVAVELALHQDGNLLSAVHGVTNDAGIDYLSIDTSTLSSGVGYWLDINIGGVYLTGQSIVAGSTDCGTPKSISTTGTISVVPGASGNTSADVSGMTGTGAGSKQAWPR